MRNIAYTTLEPKTFMHKKQNTRIMIPISALENGIVEIAMQAVTNSICKRPVV
jgi:hypothetical protein